MNYTPLVRPWFIHKAGQPLTWRGRVEDVQRATLSWLISHGSHTKWGHERGLDRVQDYEGYSRAVPARRHILR